MAAGTVTVAAALAAARVSSLRLTESSGCREKVFRIERPTATVGGRTHLPFLKVGRPARTTMWVLSASLSEGAIASASGRGSGPPSPGRQRNPAGPAAGGEFGAASWQGSPRLPPGAAAAGRLPASPKKHAA